jgi:hypothetical protein
MGAAVKAQCWFCDRAPLSEVPGLAGRRLSRGVTSLGESGSDLFAGIPHVIRLGLTRCAASVITEANALQELGKLPRFGFAQHDGDLDGAHDSVGLDVAAAGIDQSFDAPGEAPMIEQARELQGAVELM